MSDQRNFGTTAHTERRGFRLNGWLMLLAVLILFCNGFWLLQNLFEPAGTRSGSVTSMAGLVLALAVTLSKGLFVLQPNESAVLLLFGSYQGTIRRTGLGWTNPFCRRMKISLRARNLVSETLKVNDRLGNPIEIAGIVVWRIADTAQAMFDVENYEQYIRIQTEAAIRHLANQFAYDNDEDGRLTLLTGGDQLFQVLHTELQDRLARAGVKVEEARLAHLAYAPEIAQAMLRRQQADAVIGARQKIVNGAVGMVEMALAQLQERGIIEFDSERKAAMVSNLLVVLCGESDTQPVINTGTLYH
ncbi:MAG: SPFH domain-containing protein [Verrucomicrobia bacterium]|nr:SPFH domain-containing protein [Verrucomicrobiota bacterium]